MPRVEMAIDYFAQSEAYRPAVIETLLVGEAPPPNKTSYFYLPTSLRSSRAIRDDRRLPPTIFHHYFQKVPADATEYEQLLLKLKAQGVFLVDILDTPIKVRNSPEGLQQVIDAIPLLRAKLKPRRIEVQDESIIFLLARETYRTHIRREFPRSKMMRWIDFRMSRVNSRGHR